MTKCLLTTLNSFVILWFSWKTWSWAKQTHTRAHTHTTPVICWQMTPCSDLSPKWKRLNLRLYMKCWIIKTQASAESWRQSVCQGGGGRSFPSHAGNLWCTLSSESSSGSYGWFHANVCSFSIFFSILAFSFMIQSYILLFSHGRNG